MSRRKVKLYEIFLLVFLSFKRFIHSVMVFQIQVTIELAIRTTAWPLQKKIKAHWKAKGSFYFTENYERKKQKKIYSGPVLL